MNYKLKTIIIILLSSLIVSCSFISDGIPEIDKYIMKNEFIEEYKSERSFGNDRMDVYSFTDEMNDFDYKNDKEELIDKLDYFPLDIELNKDLYNEIISLAEEDDVLFANEDEGSTEYLIFYSPKNQKGYIILNTI